MVARDPGLGRLARDAVLEAGCPAPTLLADDASLLRAVIAQTGGLTHLLIEDGPHGLDPALLDALAEASPAARIALLPTAATAQSIAALLREGGQQARAPGPALRPGGLMLRYQPILSARHLRLEMVEALARWASEPVALTPAQFVPDMERMGLGHALAGAVARLATQDMAKLPWPLKVSINLAVAEFQRGDVAAWLARERKRARLPAARLAIELTETSPVVDVARLARALRRLRAAGHEVVMDDFVLDDPRRRLLRLPFSGVKLDRSLVRMLPRSARARRQVREICGRGLVVTAEGVAGLADLRQLRALGVRRLQGFWLARPMPVHALEAWGRQRAAQPRKTRA